MNEELKEWLGLKPADLLVYGAIAAIAGMYWTRVVAVDLVLAVLAIGLCVLSCRWGMPSDPRLGKFTNAIKAVAYPLCLVTTIALVGLNFIRWNQ